MRSEWVWWNKTEGGVAVGPRDKGCQAIVFTVEEAQAICQAVNSRSERRPKQVGVTPRRDGVNFEETMTVDDALKIIAQERLDVRGEVIAQGGTEQEAIDMTADIAAYVLHDAVLKDRKYIALLQDQKLELAQEIRDTARSAYQEAAWKHAQGDEYGSY